MDVVCLSGLKLVPLGPILNINHAWVHFWVCLQELLVRVSARQRLSEA